MDVTTDEQKRQKEAEEREKENERRQEQIKQVPLYSPNEGSWPQGVRSVGIGELSNLGIDRTGQLYWAGKPVKTQNRIRLNGWQAFFGILAASATVGLFAIEAMRFLGVEVS